MVIPRMGRGKQAGARRSADGREGLQSMPVGVLFLTGSSPQARGTRAPGIQRVTMPLDPRMRGEHSAAPSAFQRISHPVASGPIISLW
jgi:hypothetical protein